MTWQFVGSPATVAYFKDVTSIATGIATIIALSVGTWKFVRFRSLSQSVTLTLSAADAVTEVGAVCVYVNVDVQNVGNVVIFGRSCVVALMPLHGEANLLPAPLTKKLDLDDDDELALYVLDKGEFNTFGFAFDLRAVSGETRVTACRITAEYSSQQRTGPDVYLTWLRQTMFVPDGRGAGDLDKKERR